MGQIGSILHVRDTGTSRGRGVFTREKIQSGTLFEACPVIVLNEVERAHVKQTKLDHYYYLWGADKMQAAIVLGFGLLYNHSYSPNARYHRDLEKGVLNFVALREILPGEEIMINYNGDPADQTYFPLPVPTNADPPSKL